MRERDISSALRFLQCRALDTGRKYDCEAGIVAIIDTEGGEELEIMGIDMA